MMNTLARSVLTLYTYDDRADDISLPNVLRQCLQLIALFPMLSVYGYQAYSHYHDGKSLFIHAPVPELSTAENILYTLRADSYQDLVNALLLLLGEHSEEGVVRIYSEEDAAAMAEQACKEVQEETALGAYLLDYISYTDTQERAYYEMHVRLGYRRTAEEQAGIITATSTEALPDLLRLTAEEGTVKRIAVRFGYFTTDRDGLRAMVRAVQHEVDPTFDQPWEVTCLLYTSPSPRD